MLKKNTNKIAQHTTNKSINFIHQTHIKGYGEISIQKLENEGCH